MNLDSTPGPGIGLPENYKILIIDDDDASRYMLRYILEKDGHQVFEAENGEEGLAKYREVSPDIIITDIVMPKIEGITLIRNLREKNPDLPVIAMTSDVHGRAHEFLELSKQVGASTIIEKPITADNLSAALLESLQTIE